MHKTLVALALILSTTFATLADKTVTATFGSTTDGWTTTGANSDKIGKFVVDIGDFNGDTYKDYAVAGSSLNVYIILGQANGRTATLDLSTAAASSFYTITLPAGAAVTGLAGGDLNGDGSADLAIASAGSDKVYVVYGKGTAARPTWATWTDVTIVNDGTLVDNKGFTVKLATGTGVGGAIAIADFLDDTKADLLIGMPEWLDTAATKGAVCVVYGKQNNLAAAAGVSSSTSRGNDIVDCSTQATLNVAPVVAPATSGVDVFEGQIIKGAAASDKIGVAIAGGYDLNGDNNKDLFVAGSGSNNIGYIIYGDGNRAAGTAIATSTGIDLNTLAAGKKCAVTLPSTGAITVANFVGDFNGDTRPDLALGHPGASTGSKTGNGKVYVIFGQTASFTTVPLVLSSIVAANGITYTGKEDGGNFGTSLDAAGDVNNDGTADIIVSAPHADGVRTNAGVTGKVYILYGSSANNAAVDLGSAATFRGITITGVAASAFGASVSGAGGSIGGDASADFIVGAPELSRATPGSNTGTVYEFRGQVIDTATTPASGFRLHASLLVLASFFVALMF